MSALPLRAAEPEVPIRLRARDVMTSPVITVRPETAIKDVAALLLAHHVSGLPVLTHEGELIGIVTEADLLVKEATPGGEPGRPRSPRRRGLRSLAPSDEEKKAAGLTARDLMSTPVITVEEEATLHEIAALMVQRKINRVPVLRAGRLAGIVSRADVLHAFTRTDAEIAQAVRQALLHDLWIDTSTLQVEVRDGVVYLEGRVERRSERELVTRWAGTVDGVVAVESALTYAYDDHAVRLGDRWPQQRV